jgi:hypothetical protein
MKASSDYSRRERRLADLRQETAELERKLDSMRMSLEEQLEPPARETAAGHVADGRCRTRQPAGRYHHGDEPAFVAPPVRNGHQETPELDDDPFSAEWRTEALVSHGRHSTYHRRLRPGRKTVGIGAAVALVITITLAIVLSGSGASWPSSVAVVENQAARACQNPDVTSEPDQVDFACAKDSRQVLWVFALMTSDDNPQFSDPRTGRVGLEPIMPEQGGQVAWSLNLHHPYNPLNPMDSLEVAARAINSIIGGATVTSTNGSPVVQPGLEASPANCLRYTGAAAVSSRQGFPGLCARPVTTPAGQAALVADVYQRWMVGATPQAAEDVAVLFENAANPGDPQVQAILRQLQNRAP